MKEVIAFRGHAFLPDSSQWILRASQHVPGAWRAFPYHPCWRSSISLNGHHVPSTTTTLFLCKYYWARACSRRVNGSSTALVSYSPTSSFVHRPFSNRNQKEELKHSRSSLSPCSWKKEKKKGKNFKAVLFPPRNCRTAKPDVIDRNVFFMYLLYCRHYQNTALAS